MRAGTLRVLYSRRATSESDLLDQEIDSAARAIGCEISVIEKDMWEVYHNAAAAYARNFACSIVKTWFDSPKNGTERRALAYELGLPRNTFSQISNGRQLPEAPRLLYMASILREDLNELIPNQNEITLAAWKGVVSSVRTNWFVQRKLVQGYEVSGDIRAVRRDDVLYLRCAESLDWNIEGQQALQKFRAIVSPCLEDASYLLNERALGLLVTHWGDAYCLARHILPFDLQPFDIANSYPMDHSV